MVENEHFNRAGPTLNLLLGIHETLYSTFKSKGSFGSAHKMSTKNRGEVMLTRDCHPSAILMTVDEFESWQETKDIVSDPELTREIQHCLRQ